MLIFAENFGPLLGWLVIVPLVLVVLGRVAILFMRQRSGERPWWGLAIGLVLIVCGAGMLLMFLTMRGGAPAFCYVLAAIPILVGIRCLIAWNKKPRDSDSMPINPRDGF